MSIYIYIYISIHMNLYKHMYIQTYIYVYIPSYIVQSGIVKLVCLKPLNPAVKLNAWITENCKETVYAGTPG
jgi:hypothetical protein